MLMSRSLYWRIPHRRSHLIKSDKLMRLLELEYCLDLLSFTNIPPVYSTDILSAIRATIENYGSDNKENKKDMETLLELIEAIEKHGEIGYFMNIEWLHIIIAINCIITSIMIAWNMGNRKNESSLWWLESRVKTLEKEVSCLRLLVKLQNF